MSLALSHVASAKPPIDHRFGQWLLILSHHHLHYCLMEAADVCVFRRKACALLRLNRNHHRLNHLRSCLGDLSFRNDLNSPLNHAPLANPDISAELISLCTQGTNWEVPNPSAFCQVYSETWVSTSLLAHYNNSQYVFLTPISFFAVVSFPVNSIRVLLWSLFVRSCLVFRTAGSISWSSHCSCQSRSITGRSYRFQLALAHLKPGTFSLSDLRSRWRSHRFHWTPHSVAEGNAMIPISFFRCLRRTFF